MRAALVALLTLSAACARIPADRYGVRSLELRGMHDMDEGSLRSCLVTTERESSGITLSATEPKCGMPPFDEHRPRLRLWTSSGTAWPVYDRRDLQEDLLRIERWYQARGYHDARLVRTVISPAQAARSDVLPPRDLHPGCERLRRGDGCPLDVAIRIEEGQPTRVAAVRVRGLGTLPAALRREVRRTVALRRGDRFDEALHEKSKREIVELLGEHGRARARVQGVVRVDRPRHRATIELDVTPGPLCRFGAVQVGGTGGRWISLIRRTAAIRRGAPFRRSDLLDAQAAVYSMGAFAIVIVEPLLPEPDDPGNPPIDVRVRVVPLGRQRFGLGFGVQSGIIGAGQGLEQTSVPQWDAHLLARYTRRRFLGGLGELSLEDRLRLILPTSFPGLETPRVGNGVLAELRQPGVVEARTWGVLSVGHEIGPDPFDQYYRHRIDGGVAAERYFLFGQRLFVEAAVRNSVSLVPGGQTTQAGDPAPESSVVTFWEQRVRLDLRDNPLRPHAGASFDVTVHEAGWALPSDFRYVRLLPDARLYVPLPWHVTLAVRFALGLLWMDDADPDLDALSRQLGPRDFRLRGGGPSSNRGFLAGRLGDGPEGGLRRWEASAELRVPITTSLGVLWFVDAGDVHRQASFRFDHPQTSLGFGLRAFTPLGAFALDLGWRVPGWQVLGDTDTRTPGVAETDVSIFSWRFPGAVHFSLGEAF